MTKVEQYEHIRRCYYLEHLSINKIIKRLKVHKRTVHQALANAIPSERKVTKRTGTITLEMEAAIKNWLRLDADAPKKQRHTSHRIYQRLVREYKYSGKEPTLRKHVGRYRRELNLKSEIFVPQVHMPGEEAEVDWYEAVVNFPWGREKSQIFEMRACYSGKEFHIGFPHQTQQAFFEGHAAAFNYYGGVFKKIRYDNLSSAVNKVLKGRQRKEQENFIKLRSHYLFESIFCLPGKKGAHEKGGVECGVGRFRRQYFVPVPQFCNYTELNDYLLESCQTDCERKIIGHEKIIKEDWLIEAKKLLTLPQNHFPSDEVKTPSVNSKSLVCVNQNHYSVPTQYVGYKVEARLSALQLSLWQAGKIIATHSRLYGKNKTRAKLDHYLEFLKMKPRALRGSLPLAQTKAQNQWHKTFDELWQVFIDREGESSGTRSFIDVLLLSRCYSAKNLIKACQSALEQGAINANAIEYIIKHAQLSHSKIDPLSEHKELKKYGSSPRNISIYDQLLTKPTNRGEYHE